jgi:hypothetical protein
MRSKWLAVMLAAVLTAQQPKEYPAAPLVEKNDPLRAPLLLLREGKTAEARKLLANQHGSAVSDRAFVPC